MIYVIIIALIAAYLMVAYSKRWLPFKAKSVESATSNDIVKALARLTIPAPDLAYRGTTPKGASFASVVPVPQVALDTIDAGLDELFVWYHSAYPAWVKAFRHSDYAVMFIEPMARIDEGSDIGAPSILVQGHESAGTCIGFPFPMVFLVLPHQAQQGWTFKNYLFQSVFNEGEHYIESRNSRETFNQFTGFNDVHRHVAAPTAAVGFMAKPVAKVNCGLQKVDL